MYMIYLVALYISWHFTSYDTLHLVILHISCYFTYHENQDFNKKFLNFTCEYLCVTTPGLSHISEVVVELYHMPQQEFPLRCVLVVHLYQYLECSQSTMSFLPQAHF